MAIRHIEKSFVFPRIPLHFKLPDNYPDLGRISNVSVIPEIRHFRFGREELEIKGEYQIAVSYTRPKADTDKYENTETFDDFFSILKIQSNGLLADEETGDKSEEFKDFPELYTVHFTKPFHTYLDMHLIYRPRFFKPGMVVESMHLEISDDRTMKGQLVLGLVNTARRGFR